MFDKIDLTENKILTKKYKMFSSRKIPTNQDSNYGYSIFSLCCCREYVAVDFKRFFLKDILPHDLSSTFEKTFPEKDNEMADIFKFAVMAADSDARMTEMIESIRIKMEEIAAEMSEGVYL